MKNTVKTFLFAFVFTAVGFAQTPNQFGAWSIYESGNHSGNHVIMLQSTSRALYNGDVSNGNQAKLDVICRNGKLAAVALEPSVNVMKTSLSNSGSVTTTRISFSVAGQMNQTENWAVLDEGHSLSPYSELLQGKQMRQWVERIAGTDQLAIQLHAEEGLAESAFPTADLAGALASVGCQY